MDRPYVISWNLTYRCNLACEHCYLDAGPKKVSTENFSDRSELSTDECKAIIDQIVEFAPECLTILTGGEPLLRRDILEIIKYAADKKLWVVVGTNGVKVTEIVADKLKAAGARGMALSLDGLDAEVHDKFRMVKGAWENTVKGAKVLAAANLPFIVQTTVGQHNNREIEEIADFAYHEMGATVWNLYFLVQTGRGQFVSDMSAEDYDEVLQALSRLQKKYQNKMMVNAKCAPHYIKTLFEENRESPFLKTFSGGAGGCPAGTHYMGIRPNGDMTPCPYLPKFAGNLREENIREIWENSELFSGIRLRNKLGGRCGSCEFNQACGGCRARAFGVTGDYMAEDPLCSYQPGKYQAEEINLPGASSYGEALTKTIEWDTDARERMDKIPAFVRGMVIKRVEEQCKKEGLFRVTVSELDKIRSRMPTPKVFGRYSKND